jgi:pimeloyl-ACP methyl ester carboxylesterase
VEGSGPPVVLIHGLFASAQMNWGVPGIIRALAQDYQVIAMDVRGHGGSDKPDEEKAYGVELAEDVARLLDHLKIKKAHVIGYSMGGLITMKLMTLHPERVQSAVLGGMGWLREGGGLQDFWRRMPERKGGPGVPYACIRTLGALAVTEAEVRAIRIPVAVVIGEVDAGKGLYVDPLQKVRPDWPVTVIDGAGHINCIFKPEFKTALKAWLDKQPKPPSAADSH